MRIARISTLMIAAAVLTVGTTAWGQAGTWGSSFDSGVENVTNDPGKGGIGIFLSSDDQILSRQVNPVGDDSDIDADSYGVKLDTGPWDRMAPTNLTESTVTPGTPAVWGADTPNLDLTVGPTTYQLGVKPSLTTTQTKSWGTQINNRTVWEWSRGATLLPGGTVYTYGSDERPRDYEMPGNFRMGAVDNGDGTQTIAAYSASRFGDTNDMAHVFADTDFLVDFNDLDGDGYIHEWSTADKENTIGRGLFTANDATNAYNPQLDAEAVDRNEIVLATGVPIGTIDYEITIDPRVGGTATEMSAWFNQEGTEFGDGMGTEADGRIESLHTEYIQATITASYLDGNNVRQTVDLAPSDPETTAAVLGIGIRPGGAGGGLPVFGGELDTEYDYLNITVQDDTTGDPLVQYTPDTWQLTSAGDANRDGLVDLNDANALVGNFNATGVGGNDPSVDNWAVGDFNDDDNVNLSDANILVGNFGADYSQLNWSSGGGDPLAAVTPDTAGTTGAAEWTFDAVVNGLSTTITIDAVEQALLSTTALDGATLTLVQQAVPFSTAQPGPGAQVGEFLTSNFVTGQEIIDITVPDFGIYTFEALYNTAGGGAGTTQTFQIEFIPEPTSIALLGLGGLALLRRRRA